jgi:Leucine-rich repeat (LRR) protein
MTGRIVFPALTLHPHLVIFVTLRLVALAYWPPDRKCGCTVTTGNGSSLGPVVDCRRRDIAVLSGCDIPTSDMTQLDLSENLGITTWNYTVSTPCLRTLTLDRCRLTTVEYRAFDGSRLPVLETLRLSDNLIATIAESSFQGLSSLFQLWMDGNELESLPSRLFDGLTLLRILHLERNRLVDIPANSMIGAGIYVILIVFIPKFMIIYFPYSIIFQPKL